MFPRAAEPAFEAAESKPPPRDTRSGAPSQGDSGSSPTFLPRLSSIRMDELLTRITVNPAQCGGRPCIRGMRMRVIDILDLLAAGLDAQ